MLFLNNSYQKEFECKIVDIKNNQIILDQTKSYTFPICFGFPAGHLNDNRCIKFGVTSVLEITKNGVSLSQ